MKQWYEYDLKKLGEDHSRLKKSIAQHEAGHATMCHAVGKEMWAARIWKVSDKKWGGRTIQDDYDHSSYNRAVIGWGGAIANAVSNYRIPFYHVSVGNDKICKSLAQFVAVRNLSTTDMQAIIGAPPDTLHGKKGGFWNDYAYETFHNAWCKFFEHRRKWRDISKRLLAGERVVHGFRPDSPELDRYLGFDGHNPEVNP